MHASEASEAPRKDAVIETRFEIEWSAPAPVLLDADGNLLFPVIHRKPAVYQMQWSRDGRRFVYTGETEDLSRHVGHIRNPGPTQQTNLRVNERVTAALDAGGSASIRWASRLHGNGKAIDFDPAAKTDRRLAVRAAIVEAWLAGLVVENL